jgi:ribonucleoside-diphosphate reductase alpha chain
MKRAAKKLTYNILCFLKKYIDKEHNILYINPYTEEKEMKISDNALTVLKKRYLKKDDSGKPVETVEQLFRRVAVTVAEADKNYDNEADIKALSNEFYTFMTDMDFLPNSPTLMNAGKPLGQLSACFVLPIEDSMEQIFETVKNAALIHKSGGGTGFSFSRLRPKGATVIQREALRAGLSAL